MKLLVEFLVEYSLLEKRRELNWMSFRGSLHHFQDQSQRMCCMHFMAL